MNGYERKLIEKIGIALACLQAGTLEEWWILLYCLNYIYNIFRGNFVLGIFRLNSYDLTSECSSCMGRGQTQIHFSFFFLLHTLNSIEVNFEVKSL